MSEADFTRRADQETPLGFHWRDSNRATKDMSTGYTFGFYLVSFATGGVVLSKTTGIEGFDTNPNIVVTPGSDWWTGLSGRYMIHLMANDGTGDDFFRIERPPTIEIISVPT